MKNFQKKLSVLLAFVLCLSMSCFGVLAENEIPSDLPEGTIKLAEGIYAYTSSVALLNTIGPVNIGTVPAYGNIIQPGQFSNVIVNTGHRYICIKSTQSILVNFVYGTQTIFGSQLYQWPQIGGSLTTTYFIDADYYNFTKGVPYQLQCTSINDLPRQNTQIHIHTDVSKVQL